MASVAPLGQPVSQEPNVPDQREEPLCFEELDITSSNLSLAGIEKEIEAFADSEVLRAILDRGIA